jgi:hypothetical protein
MCLCRQVRCGRIIFMQFQKIKLPPPPGLVASLAAGFDAVANHVAIILLPFLLDLLLWLGPHLSMKALMQPVVDGLAKSQVPLPASLPDVSSMQQMWEGILTRFNLIGLLRTFPLGVPSLLSGSMPTTTPLGAPTTWELVHTHPVWLDAGKCLFLPGLQCNHCTRSKTCAESFNSTGYAVVLHLVGIMPCGRHPYSFVIFCPDGIEFHAGPGWNIYFYAVCHLDHPAGFLFATRYLFIPAERIRIHFAGIAHDALYPSQQRVVPAEQLVDQRGLRLLVVHSSQQLLVNAGWDRRSCLYFNRAAGCQFLLL